MRIFQLSFLLSSVFTPLSSLDAKESRPNIVFLLADDMRHDSFGFIKKFEVQTPTLDRLAKPGVHFTRSYNTTSICQASRAQIMTGMYEFSTGTNFAHGGMKNEIWQNSYPVTLKKNGYYTGFIGKFGFHVYNKDGKKGSSETVKPAFDFWAGFMGQGKYEITDNPEATEWFERYGDKKEHTTYALGMLGQDFVKEAVKTGKPFCLSVSFKAPHGPFSYDKRYEEVYAGKTFSKPENYGQEHAEHLPAQAKVSRPYASKSKSWLKDYDKTMRQYHTMIYGLDQAVDKILQQLEASGVADNTVIIFTADNGFFNGSKGMGGKILAYEEGSLAPSFIYDPRRKTGEEFSSRDALVGNIDFANTILDYAGVEPLKGSQGKSMIPLFKDKGAKNHDALMLINAWGYKASQSLSVVTPTHKYIHWWYGGDGYERAEELYDMKRDRLEANNLAQNPEHEAALKEMRQKYDGFIDLWKKAGVQHNGYAKYSRLGDRNIPFDQQKAEDIAELDKQFSGTHDGDKKVKPSKGDPKRVRKSQAERKPKKEG